MNFRNALCIKIQANPVSEEQDDIMRIVTVPITRDESIDMVGLDSFNYSQYNIDAALNTQNVR